MGLDGRRMSIDTPAWTSRRRLRRAALLAVTIASLVLPACGGGSDASGDALPEVRLTDLASGDEVSWEADGTPLVVNLWASWCTPCRAEMPAFDRVAERLDGEVAIVGITDELDRDAAEATAAELGVSYPLRYDEDQTLMTDLGVSGLPATVFVGEDGTVLGRHLGALTEDELLQEIEERYGITS
jgi:thiol-disulfide isomerase/thioredoxin